MKKIITCLFFIILMVSPLMVHSQSSLSLEFRSYMKAGEREFQKKNYYEARRQFQLAKAVKNNGDTLSAQKKISECNMAINSNPQKSRTEATISKADMNKKKFEKAKALYDSMDYNAALPLFMEIQNDIKECQSYINVCNEKIVEKLGYIKVNDIEFGIGSPYGLSTNYGEKLFASDITEEEHIKAKVLYNLYSAVQNEYEDFAFHFRIWDESNNMILDPGDPYSVYTQSWSGRTISQKGILIGDFFLNLAPGKYRCEFFINDVTLFEKELILNLKPGEASYFNVNGEASALYEEVDAEGGVYTYEVNTDASDLELKKTTSNIEERCLLTLDGNILQVKFRPNYSLRQIDATIELSAGGRSVPITFIQKPTNNIGSGNWISRLDSIMATGKKQARTFTFKGEDFFSKEHWNIIHLESSSMWFIGVLDNQNHFKEGLYLSGRPATYCIDGFTSFFSGEFKNNLTSNGNCYDIMGNLIFSGKCVGGHPFPETDYPNRDEYYPTDHTFHNRLDYIVEDNGNAYLGEVVKGKRNGFGIYMWTNGDCWFGKWENGNSIKGVFIDALGQTIIHNRFEDNVRN